jgi:hypothetical protein
VGNERERLTVSGKREVETNRNKRTICTERKNKVRERRAE